jgi:hypothetical protein
MPSAFPFDQFDEAGVDFSLGAILDDEALALAGAPWPQGLTRPFSGPTASSPSSAIAEKTVRL